MIHRQNHGLQTYTSVKKISLLHQTLLSTKNGIFQGDELSTLLFILSMSPLSFILNKLKYYSTGKENNREINITHLFFVGDLKLCAPNYLNIQQINEGESYKYLGIDENISFDGTIKKKRVLTE